MENSTPTYPPKKLPNSAASFVSIILDVLKYASLKMMQKKDVIAIGKNRIKIIIITHWILPEINSFEIFNIHIQLSYGGNLVAFLISQTQAH